MDDLHLRRQRPEGPSPGPLPRRLVPRLPGGGPGLSVHPVGPAGAPLHPPGRTGGARPRKRVDERGTLMTDAGAGRDLDLDEAGGVAWDALVVGAGPAGALAAYGMARAGARVLLVDK